VSGAELSALVDRVKALEETVDDLVSGSLATLDALPPSNQARFFDLLSAVMEDTKRVIESACNESVVGRVEVSVNALHDLEASRDALIGASWTTASGAVLTVPA